MGKEAKFVVRLSGEERELLEGFTKAPRVARAKALRARMLLVTERRTAEDYAHTIRHLVDVMYPEAEKIVLVQDNLNTHKPASLYAAFPPKKPAG